MELKNGVYEGELTNYKREGRGILFGDEGIMYIGFEDIYKIRMKSEKNGIRYLYFFFLYKETGKMIS